MVTKEIQQGPLVADDLSPYRGTWVAIRGGRVIASALDPIELRDREDVGEDDYLMLVPSESVGTYLL